MARVSLEILRGPYRPALVGGVRVESCRLLTDVSLRRDNGWTPFRPAILDTGAPLSLFPRRLWRAAETRPMCGVHVGGLPRKPECMFDATLAVVVMTIRDRAVEFPPIEAPALLADNDDVPTLLGMRGVLTELVLYANVRADEAYLEITEATPRAEPIPSRNE